MRSRVVTADRPRTDYCYDSADMHISSTPRPSFSTALLVLAALAGCATGPPPPPSPLQQAGLDAKRVVIAPMNLVSSLPPKLEGSTQFVSDAIRAHLEAHGKSVASMPHRAGFDLWRQSTLQVKEAGKARNFENAASLFAARLSENDDFDILIFPSLFVQNTTGSLTRSSKWDGAKQRLNSRGELKNMRGSLSGKMNVKAASLYIAVVDRSGNVLQTKRAGLELIQHMALASHRNFDAHTYTADIEYNDPVIGDEERLRDGVARAFAPFLAEQSPLASEPRVTVPADKPVGSRPSPSPSPPPS